MTAVRLWLRSNRLCQLATVLLAVTACGGDNPAAATSARPSASIASVKPGWVWYLEETACDPGQSGCGPWGTRPSGKVLAMNLADGVERQVDFLYAEETTDLVPGEFWPSS